MVSPYSGQEPKFVNGVMVGLRTFVLDSRDGSLHGPYRSYRFADGVNVAECGAGAEHAVASLGCTCGFYAYHRSSLYNAPIGDVKAIVEGFGRATVGDQGFRCEKMRIVAIIDHRLKRSPEASMNRFQRLASWQAESKNYKWFAVIVFALALLGSAVHYLLSTPVPLGFVSLLYVPVSVYGTILNGRVADHVWDHFWPGGGLDLDQTRELYPSARFYGSVSEALEDFPLTPQLRRTGVA